MGIYLVMTPDKVFFFFFCFFFGGGGGGGGFQPKGTDIFLFFHENICCGYSLEAPDGEIRKILCGYPHGMAQ